ncbi:MAG: flagellar hook protein FlgE [Tissierellales bacterium]|nr:flagellar hook protein FlgE [Tissierellales bacterium]
MMRSMYSGVSGLRIHQSKMDVIGNNIANVNTVGFKKGQVSFKDLMSQMVSSASGATEDGLGGTNPQQLGLGASVGSISTIHTNGSTQSTNNPNDLQIVGNGYFVVTPDGGTNSFYTRAGNFKMDEQGNLLTADGMKVMGYEYTEDGEETGTKSPVKINFSEQVKPVTTKGINFKNNLNDAHSPYRIIDTTKTPAEIETHENNTFSTDLEIQDSKGNTYNITINLNRNVLKYDDGGTIKENAVWEVSIPSMTQKGSKTNLLEGNTLDYIMKFDEQGELVGLADANGGAAPFPPIHSLNPGDIDSATAANYFNDDNYKDAAGNFVKSFNLQIQKEGVEFGEGIDLDGNGTIEDAEKGFIKMDFSDVSGFGIDTSIKGFQVKGEKAGTLTGYSIDSKGVVEGQFSNGESKALFKLMLAKFDNPGGLIKEGSNLFSESANSGVAQEGKPGSPGFGGLNSGSLEMSNVDLSMEFTEMITAQRGFQANSRIITTTDEMLQELVNLKR